MSKQATDIENKGVEQASCLTLVFCLEGALFASFAIVNPINGATKEFSVTSCNIVFHNFCALMLRGQFHGFFDTAF
jgi:hypothetical protein